MSERDERLAVQGLRGPQGNQGNMGNQGNPGSRGNQGEPGERGEQGEQGEKGMPGLSRPVRRALVYLFTLSVALAAFSLFWTSHEVHASQDAIRASYDREQAAVCMTLAKLADLKPPAGNPKTHPGRVYLQGQHDTLDEISADLGCK